MARLTFFSRRFITLWNQFNFSQFNSNFHFIDAKLTAGKVICKEAQRKLFMALGRGNDAADDEDALAIR